MEFEKDLIEYGEEAMLLKCRLCENFFQIPRKDVYDKNDVMFLIEHTMIHENSRMEIRLS